MRLKPVILMVQILNFGPVRSSEVNKFSETSDCTCEGYDVTYECRVMGEGAIIWRGSAFRCSATNNEITLLHTDRMGECNDGKISGTIVAAENNSYTSQLTALVSSEMVGRTIGCFHDGSAGTTEIGSSNLTITAVSYSPPEDIRLVNASFSHLTFQWSSVSANCPALYYNISASNCGHCPPKSNQTTVTCTGMYVNGQVCKFSLQTIMCSDNVPNKSTELLVILRVPGSPNVTVIPVYSHISRKLSGLKTWFSKESIFIAAGFDGSALSYIINYTDVTSGVVCASVTVLASSCMDDISCEHDFRLASTPCISSSQITVTVRGANLLGEGLPSAPVSIRGTTNHFVNVSFEPSSKTVSCLFLKQQRHSKKSCSIAYGLQGDTCGTLTQQSSNNTNVSDTVIVGFPVGDYVQLESDGDYCFTLTASNGTFNVIVEGTFHTMTGTNSVSGVQALMIGIIPFGSTIGAMALVVVTITTTFILITAILLKSRRALQMDLEHIKAKQSEQPVYEELDKVIPTSPSPTMIDTIQNTAYTSVPALVHYDINL